MAEPNKIDNYDIVYQLVGERIRELRERNEDSQFELAQKISISRSSISNIEKGRHPASLALLYDIATIYNSDINSLLPSIEQVTHEQQSPNIRINEILDDYDLGDSTRQQILNRIK
jgi:transcriptional regulator with XRE-family HTH domain